MLLPKIDFYKLETLSNIAKSRIPLALVSAIINEIFWHYQEEIPTSLLKFIKIFGSKKYTTIKVDQLPYRFRLRDIAEAITEKLNRKYYLFSILDFAQAFHSQKELNHIIFHIILRRKRITY
jgi:hypothetical protein